MHTHCEGGFFSFPNSTANGAFTTLEKARRAFLQRQPVADKTKRCASADIVRGRPDFEGAPTPRASMLQSGTEQIFTVEITGDEGAAFVGKRQRNTTATSKPTRAFHHRQ